MAHDGLKLTGEYHSGSRWVAQAHYPKITDYEEDSFPTRDEAMDFMKIHCDNGANVQIHEHKWVETFIASGWYPARK